MPDLKVMITMPSGLCREAAELANLRGITLSDLVAEALEDSLEMNARRGWPLRRIGPSSDRRPRIERLTG